MIKEISSISSKKIKISSGEGNTIFDNTSGKKIIKRQLILGKNSDLELYGIIYASSNYELEIFLDGTNSNLKVNYLLLGDKNSKIKFKINSKILASKSKSNISIISMVANYGDIEVDGNIKIDKGLEEIEANIFEENVFLGDTGKIRAIPALEIHSQDIRASHSLKIEKISNEKLFYLRSRGIDKKDATTIMLFGLVENNFGGLKIKDPDFFSKRVLTIYKKFLNITS